MTKSPLKMDNYWHVYRTCRENSRMTWLMIILQSYLSLLFTLDFINEIHNAEIHGSINGHTSKNYPNQTGGSTFGDEYYQYCPKNYSKHRISIFMCQLMLAPSLRACQNQAKAHRITRMNDISDCFICCNESHSDFHWQNQRHLGQQNNTPKLNNLIKDFSI